MAGTGGFPLNTTSNNQNKDSHQDAAIDITALQNPTQYALNQAVASSMSTALNRFIKSKKKLSRENLMNLALIFGLEELKKLFSSAISSTADVIKNAKYLDYLKKIWEFLCKIRKIGRLLRYLNLYNYFRKSQQENKSVEMIEMPPKARTISFLPSDLFWSVLFMYITNKNKELGSDVYTNDILIQQLNKEEYKIRVSYNTLTIEYKECEFIVENISFDVKFKDKQISNIAGELSSAAEVATSFVYNEEFKSFLDFIPNTAARNAIITNFNTYYNTVCNNIKIQCSSIYAYTYLFANKTNGISSAVERINKYRVDKILNILTSNNIIPELSEDHTHRLIHELVFLLSFLVDTNVGYNITADYNNSYRALAGLSKVELLGINITSLIKSQTHIGYWLNGCTAQYLECAEYAYYMNKWLSDQLFKHQTNDQNTQQSLQVVVKSKEFKYDDAVDIWCDFITCFENIGKEARRKIKVFYLTLNKNIEIIEVDNPEYIKWKEAHDQEQLADKQSKDAKEDVEDKQDDTKKKSKKIKKIKKLEEYDSDEYYPPHFNHPYFQRHYERPPDKTIKSEKIIKTVHQEEVNDIYKNFDTLYLRKKFSTKLRAMITQFRDKRLDIEELGLRYKFCALLYGEPGTGKSSTILAVASFLVKNVYYVNLKNVETNEDIQLLFDYVNKNCMDGGIIVMEDIDAMTSVVHCRKQANENEPISESTTSNLIDSKNGILTLEYILNLLDGTLTKDGLMFFATTNHLERLDPAFRRPGRFEILIKLEKADHYQINNIYQRFFGQSLAPEILERFPEDKYTPAEIINALQCYILGKEDDELMLGEFLMPKAPVPIQIEIMDDASSNSSHSYEEI